MFKSYQNKEDFDEGFFSINTNNNMIRTIHITNDRKYMVLGLLDGQVLVYEI